MEDEPTLPRLTSWTPSDHLPIHPPKKRARLAESSPPLSSDPIFSSDDDPSADNYVQGRRKKQYRGPWYKQEAEDESEIDNTHISQKKSRTLKRQLDSGIWMGSDGTDVDFEETLPPPPNRHVAFRPSQKTVEIPWEDGAIAECLEAGSENIDLSCHGLTSISTESIRPLHAFVSAPPSDGTSFIPLVPELRLFLYQNCLTSVPGEIFKLEHLSFLSLRDNHIKELPSCIGHATKLSELNISSNKLRYLPYEILELFKPSSELRMLNIHPNPFYEPEGLADTGSFTSHRPESPGWTQIPLPPTIRHSSRGLSVVNWETSYRCSTAVRFFDISGQLLQGPSLPGEDQKESIETSFPSNPEPFQYPSLREGSRPVFQLNTPPRSRSPVGNRLPLRTSRSQPPPPRGSYTSFSPSLIESVLRTCYKHPELPSLPEAVADDHPDFPEHILSLLARTREVKESGGQKCTICGRGFIVKRTEWIEWWEIKKGDDGKSATSLASPLGSIENSRDMVESLVPLIRRGCSWGCVPNRDSGA